MTNVAKRIAELPPEKQALLSKLLREKGNRPALTITRRAHNGAFPLSYAQQRLWFLDQFSPGSAVYNIPAVLRIAGSLNRPALQKSIATIVSRHEPLRSRFVEKNGKPLQSISAEPRLELPLYDLQGLSAGEQAEEVERLAREEAQQPFHLSRGPLLRATLLKLAADEHILLVTVHHIAFDGWSTDVFLRELHILYAAYARGLTPELPLLPIRYSDYAVWQRDWLQGNQLASQLNYWREKLQQAQNVLELPTDYPRPPKLSYRGAHLSFDLPGNLMEQLDALATKTGTTRFMVLLAAFKVLLYRYSRQASLNVGIPVANRRYSELKDLIGLFVNTLVIHSDVDAALSFRQVLEQVRETTLSAYDNQDVPFEMLVEALQPERDMSRMPLFQVMFELQDAPLENMQLGDLRVERLMQETGIAKFDLMLSMVPHGRSLRGEIEYSTDLFERATIARMANHFTVLLQAIVAAPLAPIHSLPMLTAAERERLLVAWNDTTADFAANVLLHELFEQQAARTPDAVAVVAPHQNRQLTYAELDRQANRLAHYLQKMGVGPDQPVGVCLHRSPEMVLALLGVLKAGGGYVPIDPSYPRERIELMLEDAGMDVLLTEERLLSDLPRAAGQVVMMDAANPVFAGERETAPACAATAENLAYVIYTSGSTGRPKGAVVPHRAICNHMLWMQRDLPLTAADRVLQKTPFSFDASVWEFYAPLQVGATLVMAPPGAHADVAELVRTVATEEITILQLVPTLLQMIVAEEAEAFSRCRSLRRVFCGGEALEGQLVARCAALLEAEIYNLYGPSETAIDTVYWRCRPADYEGAVPIGRPVANTQLYVLDEQGQPVPEGVAGELHIGGRCVGLGYLNRPELTAEKFISNPFSDDPQARLYKTGDLVRYRADGALEFLGRLDNQVKLRGFRIELGEIEAALGAHPQVQQAVAAVREAAPQVEQLVGYYVPAEGQTPGVGELRAYLGAQLPEYMVPALFVALEALPQLPNGKVDRKALPEPDWTRRELETAPVGPRTPAEELLVGIWQEVLGVEAVGIYDNFFELGGHSLLATQVMSRLRQAFGVELPLQSLFAAPTVSGLAQEVEMARHGEEKLLDLPIVPLPDGSERPLSYAQQRLWFIDHLEPDSALYNIADGLRIEGVLDVELLRHSLNQVVWRHETLRSTFATVEGEPQLRVQDTLEIDLPVVDLTDLEQAEQARAVQQLGAEEARRPFNLSEGPLLRATLLRLSPEAHVVLFCLHHIISDGWSTAILVREVAECYRAGSSGEEPQLPDLSIQYSDFAYWQRQWLERAALDRQLAYWKEQLAGAPPLLELPTDRPRPATPAYRGGQFRFSLPVDLTADLLAFSRQHEATLFMTLLAALQVLLMRYSGQHDISVGTPIANRNRAEWEGLIGFFVNTLVMRSRLSDTQTFRELLEDVRRTALEAYAHQDAPFDLVVNAVQPSRSLSYQPLFQILFALQNAPAEPIELPDLVMSHLSLDSGAAKYDLALSAEQNGARLEGFWEYDTALFNESTIARLSSHFEVLLRSIMSRPEQSVGTVPLLTDAERQQILVDWNATDADFPQALCAHEVFEQQVATTPDVFAIRFEEEPPLTYAELNRHANQLAHHLQHLGVGVEQLVAIALERSPDLIVSILAVMKAGGAYVPLDPAYPTARLSFMLMDSQPVVLITTAELASEIPVVEGVQVVLLDAVREAIAQQPDWDPAAGATPDNLAYVIYTSGSTGKPKGVLLCHRGLCNMAAAYIRGFDIGPGSKLLQFFSSSFDGSVADIFSALLGGAELVMARQDKMLPGPDLVDLLREKQVTHAILTPSALSALPVKPLPQLELLATGGESCTLELVERWAQERRFVNVYGPTEATVVCAWFDATNLPRQAASVPIGRAMPNNKLYIVDRHMQPVPIGVEGELLVGGVGVARGYLNRPELTRDRFIINPFGNDPQERLYRTGDRVRYLPDGNIEFLGRTDAQVKVRGFRIEPGEVETRLTEHPDIRRAVVVARQSHTDDKQLVAYLELTTGSVELKVADLQAFVKQSLPAYMVPAYFVQLEELPRLPNGKVDRKTLPAPTAERSQLASSYAAPSNAAEQALTAVWKEVLHTDEVGVHDNFFELGGDSIVIIQVLSRAQKAGLHLTAKQVFQYPTIAELASVAQPVPAVAAEQGIVTGPVPLTPIQSWFFEQELPQRHHWNQSVLFNTRQPLDVERLEQTFTHLLLHHDALRLVYQNDGNGWQQRNEGTVAAVECAIFDFSQQPLWEQERNIAAEGAAVQDSLRLQQAPLLRVAYFRRGGKAPDQLLVAIHHLVVDTVSWRILAEDFEAVYEQLQAGKRIQLPPKTTSFREWALRLQEHAQSRAVVAEAGYWQQLASRRPYAHLPVDLKLEGGRNVEHSARTVTVALDEATTATLVGETVTAYAAEVNEILLAALAQAFAHWTGLPGLLVDLEGHGREEMFGEADLSRTVGWFTSLFPLFINLSPANGEIRSVVNMVKEQVRALPNRGANFGLLRYLCSEQHVKQAVAALPQPGVSFNYHGQLDNVAGAYLGIAPDQTMAGPERDVAGMRSHLIAVNVALFAGQLKFDWTFSTNLHRQATIERLATSFISTLKEISGTGDGAITGSYSPADFPDAELSPEELNMLLEGLD